MCKPSGINESDFVPGRCSHKQQENKAAHMHPFSAILYGFKNDVIFQISRQHGLRAELAVRLSLMKQFPEYDGTFSFPHPPLTPLSPTRRLRLGYVSSNFMNHAQGTPSLFVRALCVCLTYIFRRHTASYFLQVPQSERV
jgi:hypothetical protein